MTRIILTEEGKIIQALPPTLDPSSAAEQRITLKDIAHVTIVIYVLNGATVTPSAITLTQSTDIAGTGEKSLPFTEYYAALDTATSDVLVRTDATSDTFTTDGTDSVAQIFVIEVDGDELDATNDFDVLKVNIADATNQTIGAVYIGSGIRYAQDPTPTAIVD